MWHRSLAIGSEISPSTVVIKPYDLSLEELLRYAGRFEKIRSGLVVGSATQKAFKNPGFVTHIERLNTIHVPAAPFFIFGAGLYGRVGLAIADKMGWKFFHLKSLQKTSVTVQFSFP